MVLAAGSDAPQQLECIRVVDDDLVLLGVHDIEKTVLRIDGQADRIHQSLGDLVFHLVLGIEDQDAVHLPSETKSRSSSSMARPLIQPKWAS